MPSVNSPTDSPTRPLTCAFCKPSVHALSKLTVPHVTGNLHDIARNGEYVLDQDLGVVVAQPHDHLLVIQDLYHVAEDIVHIQIRAICREGGR